MNPTVGDAFLEGKKALVESFVEEIKEILELKDFIKIIFCPGYTSSGPNALACIEPLSMTMEISLIHLKDMSIEKIKEVVAHEITHKFVHGHNAEFHRRLNELLQGSWKPTFTSGLIMTDGNKKIEISKEEPNKKPIKTICNYHQCKKKTNLKRCVHCRGYFCEDHIKPSPPIFPNFDYPRKKVEWELSKKENTHPCPPYYDYLLRKKKELIKKYEESFNRMDGLIISKGYLEEEKDYYREIGKKEKSRRLKAKDITCYDCKKDILTERKEFYFDENIQKHITLCEECWDKRRQILREAEDDNLTNSKGLSLSWKFILVILTFIACAIVILLFKTILGV